MDGNIQPSNMYIYLLQITYKAREIFEDIERSDLDREKRVTEFCAISVNAFLRSHQLSGSEPRAKRSQSLGRRVRRHKEKYTSSKRGTQ